MHPLASFGTYPEWISRNSVPANQLEKLAEAQGAVIVVVPFREQILKRLRQETPFVVVGARVRTVLCNGVSSTQLDFIQSVPSHTFAL